MRCDLAGKPFVGKGLRCYHNYVRSLDRPRQLNRGKRLTEILKQPQYQPLPVEKQVAIIFAATNGYLDAVPVEKLRAYEDDLYRFLDTRHPGVLAAVAEKKILDDDIKAGLKAALDEFGQQFGASAAAA